MHELGAAALAGDRAKAERLDAELQPLHKHLFVEPNPIPVKWALNEMNKIPAGLRLPLVAMDPSHQEVVRAALRTGGATCCACTSRVFPWATRCWPAAAHPVAWPGTNRASAP